MTQKVFLYSELSEKSKKNARQWWINTELKDPGWETEHWASFEKAKKELEKSDIPEAINKSENLKLTGYIADLYLRDFIEEYNISKYSLNLFPDLEAYFRRKWDEEMQSRIDDIEFIENELKSNAFTFFSCGGRRN
jgi:hypothetical protein